MNNKIIINILIGYFIILSFVLLIQFNPKKASAVEPLSSEITAEDKLKNSVVLCIDSPLIIVNEKQFLIDDKDATITPIIQDGKVYIPVNLLQTGFNANISFSSTKRETIVRLNNKAIIFYDDTNEIDIIDSISEQKIEIASKSKIINDVFYIPLRTFAEIFEKEIFSYNDLLIISNMENIFDSIEEINIIEEILSRVNYLPIVGNQENLRNLIYKNKIYSNSELYNFNFLTKGLQLLEDTQSLEGIENAQNTEFEEEFSDVIDQIQEDLDDNQQENTYFIKSLGNYNFYANQQFLQVFYNHEEQNQFIFEIHLINQNLIDIILQGDKLILLYLTEDTEFGTKIIIYDITDNNPKKVNETDTNSFFYQVNINDGTLYLLTKLDCSKNNILPFYKSIYFKDDKEYSIEESIDLNDIYYFPDVNDNYYTIIYTIDLQDFDPNIKVYSFFGMGEKIIINDEYLYIITSNSVGKTNIYLFSFDLGKFEYLKRISLQGEILNIEEDVIFNDNSILIKTSKEEVTYTKDFK